MTPARAEKLQWISDLAGQAEGEGCRIWPWAKSRYGRIGMDGKAVYVGHIMLEQSGRPKPFPKAYMLHSCDVMACVAPWHLRWGTARENMLDASERGRQRRGHQKHNTHLQDGDVLAIRAARSQGQSAQSLADEYGIHNVTMHKLLRGATWKHLLPKDEVA